MRRIIRRRRSGAIRSNSPTAEIYTYCHEPISGAGGCASGFVGDRAGGGGLAVVPGVSVSASGFIVAVVLFSAAQATLSLIDCGSPARTRRCFSGARLACATSWR